MESEHHIGDILTCTDKTSTLYRRDLIVVYRDLAVVGLITDGLDGVHLIGLTDKDFTTSQKGVGRLTQEQEDLKKRVVEESRIFQILKGFPSLVETTMSSYYSKENPMGDTEHLVISAMVPKSLVRMYREFSVLMNMVVENDPMLKGANVDQLTTLWMINSILGVLPSLAVTKMLGGGKKEGGES